MRKVIRFSRVFVAAAVLSSVLVIGGIVGFFVMGGFNLGVDFQAGVVQEVQFAPTAFTLTWDGPGNVRLDSDGGGMVLTHSGVGPARSESFPFDEYGTVGELVAAMEYRFEGLSAELFPGVSPDSGSSWLMRGALVDPMLGSEPHRVHFLDPADGEVVDIARVRTVMEYGMGGQTVVVQSMGQPGQNHFLIRVQADEGLPAARAETGAYDDAADYDGIADVYADAAAEPPAFVFIDAEEYVADAAPAYDPVVVPAPTVRPGDGITGILEVEWPDQVVVLRSEFVGSRFAGHLTDQIGILIVATLLLVLLYATIRFKLQYAVGAVIGIVHDGIIVVAFVIITRMEFNTTTIAALLTILGYSTNNTIVVFDRIRENRRLYPDEVFVNILNRSLSETLNRTVITTVTTMLAVLSLFIFTTGAMQDFALALMVGMVSGVYTTTFIVTGFMNFWENRKVKKARRGMAIASGQLQAGKPVLSKA